MNDFGKSVLGQTLSSIEDIYENYQISGLKMNTRSMMMRTMMNSQMRSLTLSVCENKIQTAKITKICSPKSYPLYHYRHFPMKLDLGPDSVIPKDFALFTMCSVLV